MAPCERFTAGPQWANTTVKYLLPGNPPRKVFVQRVTVSYRDEILCSNRSLTFAHPASFLTATHARQPRPSPATLLCAKAHSR